jgi:hypothetical protein
MAVLNPAHLSEGKKMMVHRKDGSFVFGTLIHNDNRSNIINIEVKPGMMVQIGWSDFDRADVSILAPRHISHRFSA